MQNEVKKITRLVDEVTSLLMRSGSNDINVRIKRDSELSTITIIDYNSAYPDDETVFIGFFMLNIKYQHKGIASRIIKESIEYLKTEGHKKIRLGVDKDNP